ncbi:ankyrin repeat domain-containing protein [Planctomycetota bacterium]
MYHVINNVMMGLNKIGGVFYDYAAGVFIQSALLVILLFAIDLLLRKRVRAIFRYCVWLLVLVKLILPPMLSLPTGIGYWVGDHLPAVPGASNMAFDAVAPEHTGPSGEMPYVRPSENIAGDDPAMASADSILTPLTWQAVVFILWLAGVLAFLAVLVQRIRFVKGLVAVSCPAGDELTGLLEQCRRQIAVRRDIKLRLSEAVPSPAVCGLLRPTVLMPTSLVEKLSPEGLRATLIHELAHIKRGDLWVNSVQTFLQVVYFYNPFVWFANSIIRKVCEEAVDETVLVALGGQAKDYSNTLIDIGEIVFWKADLGLRLIGVAESKKALQWRIKHMLNRPIPKSSKLGAFGIIVIFTIAAVLLPMARAQKPSENNEPAATVNEGKSTKLLYQAAANGDIEQVKNLIAQGADVNKPGAIGWTPLLGAVNEGHVQVVKLLLENGANVDVGDGWYTPLYYPIWDDNIEIEMVKTLISGGADVNTNPKEGDFRPLAYAVWYKRPDIAKILIEAGADVNTKIKDGLTPLHVALQNADADMVKQFIGTGIKIPVFNKAILKGNLTKVKQLVEDGMNVDTPDELGWTATYWAVSAGQMEMAGYLLNQGIDVNAKTRDGHTLLHQASRAGMVEIVKSLIAKGADVDAKADEGSTPLQDAAGAGQEAVVRLLIAKGADVNTTSKDGKHSLGDAALAGHEAIIRLLLANGAKVNLRAEGRGSAVHAAAFGGHNSILDIIISNGADVNTVSRNGTPLHLAASPLGSNTKAMDNRSAQMVEKLIARGANVDAKHPQKGSTPLYGAVARGRYRTSEVLIAAGANVNATDNEGKTLLSLAKEAGRAEIVELLRKHGAKE